MRASDLRARLIAGRSPAYGMAGVRRAQEQGRARVGRFWNSGNRRPAGGVR